MSPASAGPEAPTADPAPPPAAPPPRTAGPPALPVPAILPALLALLCTACGSVQRGRLIDLGDGRVLPVAIHWKNGTPRLEALLEDSTRLEGDFREVEWAGQAWDGPLPPGHPGMKADTLYYGSGYLKRDSLVIDFEYWRSKGGISAIGKATDNRGRRYKLLF